MSPRRPIGRTPTRASRATTGSGVHAKCRWCSAPVMWLTHETTLKLAPIDLDPVPGGNIIVHRSTAGAVAGTYGVTKKGEATLFDATIGDPDARPTLHLNHWVTCQSPTARRLAAARSKSKTAPGPVTTVDGDRVGRRGDVDQLGSPPGVVAARGCRVCGEALDPGLVEAEPGTDTHPGCVPLSEGF